MSLWRWSDWLPHVAEPARITLGEGDTPLVPSRHIGPAIGLRQLFFKVEASNPTGSYKDRFASLAVSHMQAEGKTRCLATSSGNTGSALAAYCAAAGIPCHIVVVETAPLDKLRQMQAYGATVYRVRGFGLDAAITNATFEGLQSLAGREGTALQISAYAYSPVGMQGVETISFELAEQLDGMVDHVFVPAGGGGLALAVARGFERLVADAVLAGGPRVECVQPSGNNTIAGPLRDGAQRAVSTTSTTTVSGLQVPSVIDGDQTLAACRQSKGGGHLVDDMEVFEAQTRLAREEGIFCEPAGAVALAAAIRAAGEGQLDPQATVVCLVTGSGFKDGPSVDRMIGQAASPLLEWSSVERQLTVE